MSPSAPISPALITSASTVPYPVPCTAPKRPGARTAGLAVLVCLVAAGCSTAPAAHSAAPPAAAPAASASTAAEGIASSTPATAAATATTSTAAMASTAPAPAVVVPAAQPNLSAQPINLSLWQLILPVDSAGQPTGNAAAVIKPAKLISPWLVKQANGSLLFWAPAHGATTGHSLHARTELDFLQGYPAGQGKHVLTATVEIEQLPPVSQEITIGQIHGSGDYSAAPFVMLSVKGTQLTAAVVSQPQLEGSTGPSGGAVITDFPVLSGIGPNQPLAYTITEDGTEVTVSATVYSTSGAKLRSDAVTVSVPKKWQGIPVGFDAGDYEQDDAATAHSGGGKVAFYVLQAD